MDMRNVKHVYNFKGGYRVHALTDGYFEVVSGFNQVLFSTYDYNKAASKAIILGQ